MRSSAGTPSGMEPDWWIVANAIAPQQSAAKIKAIPAADDT
jgi:hypothetical protein